MTAFNKFKLCFFLGLAFLFSQSFAPTLHAQVNTVGQWQTLSTQTPINPVHIALMHNGKVLIVSGSGNLPSDTNYMAAVFDPATGTITTQPVAWDMFCNGMVVLPDGRPLVIGGTLQYDPFFGETHTSVFDPATGQFADVQTMAHGRWYPTGTVLGDGRIMTFSGLDETGATNTSVEFYSVGSGWSTPFAAPWTPPLYPRLHLLPSGKVFYSGSTTQSWTFNPSTTTWTAGPSTIYSGTRTYGSSVLLPLMPATSYKPVVIIFGGGSPATNTTELIDLSAASPKWVSGPAMSQKRIEMNATLLPNGKVVATGGSVNDEDLNTISLNADLFTPNLSTVTATMSSGGQNAFARLYHSNALLLPDATVLLIGGNPARGTYEPHLEIYSPPYLFNSNGTLATRPTITGVPSSPIGYGAAFQVQTPDAANISSAVLMRPGAPTHAFDMEQRMVGLTFTAGSGVLNVTAPPNGNIAPPGYYMLFLLNTAGVPSLASFVRLSSTPGDLPPTATITSPTSNVTILEGQSVSFAGSGSDPDGTIASYAWSFPGGNPGSSFAASPGNVTYSTPGTYTAFLTVTDNADLASATPATRTITVQPSFSLSATPASQTVTPGGATPFTVTMTPGSGFSGSVTFSVSGLPANTTASFNPASLTTSGSTTMTVSTAASTPGGSYPLTITGTNGGIQQTTPVTLVVNGGGAGTIQFVQSNYATPQNSPTQVTVPFLAAQTAGNLNIVVVGWNDSTAAVTSVTDTLLNTYTLAVGPTAVTGTLSQSIYYAKNIAAAAAGANTVTVKFSPSANVPDIRILEYSGLDRTNPLDVTAAGTGSNATADSGAGTTLNANDLLFGANTVFTGNKSAGAGYTSRIITVPDSDLAEDEVVSATGSYHATSTLTSAGPWVMQLAAFKAAGSTPTPTAPTNLTATPASPAQINLTWTASTETGGAISQYLVERCQGAACSTFVQVGTSTSTSYSDTGLTGSTSYSYRVRAQDTFADFSTYSNTATAVTPAPVITAPSNLIALASGNTQINLTWTVSTETGGTLTTYFIERCQGAGCINFVQVGTTADETPSFSDTGLSGSTSYSYRVRAGDALNNLGPYSSVSSATTAAPTLTAPSSLTAAAFSNSQVNLSWTASTESGGTISQYLIERCQSASCSNFVQVGTSTTTSYSDTGLTASTSYSYRVRATDALNNLSAYSNTSSATTPVNSPTAPGSLAASAAGPAQINLTWTASTETGGTISQYFVERCQGAGCSSFVQVGTSTTTSYSDTGLTGSTSYSYRVRASDSLNNLGPYSATASATTAAPTLTAPTGLTASPSGPVQINLSWTASTETGGTLSQYLIERCQGAGCTTFAQVGTSTTTSFSNTGLTGSTSYTYRVRATDALNNLSPYSTSSTAVTAAPTLTAPSSLTATPTSNTQINLAWTASTESGGTLSNYLVERCQGAGCSNFIQIATPAGTSYSDTSLLAATSYSYRVRATDALNNLSPYSNTASATTLSSPPPPPVITFIQVNSATPQSASAQVNVTYTKAQQVGDLNIVVVGWNDSTAAVTSVTDTLLNTYTLAVGPTAVTGTLSQSIYYAKNIAAAAAGANTVTVKFNPSANVPDIRILEYSGLDQTNPLDVTAAGTGSNATADSGAGTTLNANDLLFGANMVFTGNKSAGAGYTSRIITVPDSDLAEDEVVSATGSYHATSTLTSAGPWVMQLAAFKAAGSTPTPTAPTNLTATPASPAQINLTWTASTETGGAISQYLVERCQGAACSTFVQVGTSTSTSYSDTGLTGSTSYSYRVRAKDALNNLGPYSSSTTSTTPAPILTSPSSLTATPAGPAEVDLSWTASSETGGTVTQYWIERCQGAGCSSFTQIGTSSTTSYSDTGLTGSTSYTYRARATDALNNLSPYSAAVSAATPAPTLTAPTALTTAPVGSTQIALTWVGSTETGGTISQYLIERCQGASCSNFAQVGTSTTTSYSDTGLTASTSYSYRVRATDALNNLSAYSNTASATTPVNSPTAPGSLAASAAGPAQINLTWTASTETGGTISQYFVERCQGAGCSSFVQVGTSTTTSYSDTGLTGSTSYSYRVRASDSLNNLGPYSAPASATTAAPTLTTPTNLTATPLSSVQISLNWTGSTETGGTISQYLVERCQGAGCSNFVQVGTSSTTTFIDSGLLANTSYSYRVRASDALNNRSAYSTTATTTTFSVPPPAVITFVQVNSATPQGAAAQVNVAYTKAQQVGDLNIVVVGWNDSTAAVTSVTDTLLNTYTLAVGPTAITGTLSQSIYYAKNIAAAAAGANTVTVKFSPSANIPDIRILEYSGLDQTNPLDVTAAGTGSNATADSGAGTTLNANDLLFGANMVFTGNKSAGAGYTSRIITVPDSDLAEDEVVSATGSYHATSTLTSAGPWVMQLVALKAAASTQAGLTVSPRNIALTPGQTQQFTASGGTVTWSVNGIAGGSPAVGSITSSGLYTPPSTVGSYLIQATTTGTPTQSANATAFLTNYPGTFTYHNDIARTGQNLGETVLSPSTVNAAQFGKLSSCPVDGQVYTQPLYVEHLTISGVAHNVVFVGTQNDSVYAFDPDGQAACIQLWRASLLDSLHGAGSLAAPVPAADTGETGDISPVIGITGTPVIDPTTSTLYVVSKTKEGTAYHQRLHALSLIDGTEKFNGPTEIVASVSGSGAGSSGGSVPFSALHENQRAALLLMNGKVYITWASHGDIAPYHGWVIAYDATTLLQTDVFNVTPNGSAGGIWHAGAGPAADSSGNLYVISGNGTFDTSAKVPPASPNNDFGNTFIKLATTGGLALSDFFTPFNFSTLSANDWDLGSGGPVVLPDSFGSTAHPHLLVGGGKDGTLYLTDRDAMGGYCSNCKSANTNIVQQLSVATGDCITCGIFETPAVWQGFLYIQPVNDVLKAYSISKAQISSSPSSQSLQQFGFPGATPAISAQGSTGGIVWVVDSNGNGTPDGGPSGPAVLHAYDALNVATELWNSGLVGGRDTAGNAVKFVVPTVANGKVFVGTQTDVTVYSLLP